MPVTIKIGKAKYKSEETGQYTGFNVVGETKTSQMISDITSAGANQVGAVNTAGSNQVSSVNSAGGTQITAINAAGNSQKEAVNGAGTTHVNAINSAGSTQVGLVIAEGERQIQDIEDKGELVYNSIPSDYTELSDNVVILSNAIDANEESISDTQSMIATVEATATASKNYAVGDLLVYGGKLYEVTSAIATGATIIVGSNVTQTTVEDQLGSGSAVDDVQINGTSIVSSGVANIPIGNGTQAGVYTHSVNGRYGLTVTGSEIRINPADAGLIKKPQAFLSGDTRPIPPTLQHNSVFYGLAKAAGDSTQYDSANPVGTYTDGAKAAIQTMLGVAGIVGTVEGATASKAYAIGDAFLHSGALYKATASIVSGDAITPGTNCTQTTLISIIKGE